MLNNFDGKAVLITGGTGGIGVGIGTAFARAGASVYLTHRWGSNDEDELINHFTSQGLQAPTVLEADVSQKEDTLHLMAQLRERHETLEVFIHNVCVVPRVTALADHTRRGLLQAINYSSWPLIGYLQQIEAQFEKPPRYVIATSSDGPDHYYPGYDYVALTKGVLETFVRYAATQYRTQDCVVNALRTRQVMTESYREMFPDHARFAKNFPEFEMSAEAVGKVALAMCSGLLDCMSGQVLTVDNAGGFCDNMAHLGPRAFQGEQP